MSERHIHIVGEGIICHPDDYDRVSFLSGKEEPVLLDPNAPRHCMGRARIATVYDIHSDVRHPTNREAVALVLGPGEDFPEPSEDFYLRYVIRKSGYGVPGAVEVWTVNFRAGRIEKSGEDREYFWRQLAAPET